MIVIGNARLSKIRFDRVNYPFNDKQQKAIEKAIVKANSDDLNYIIAPEGTINRLLRKLKPKSYDEFHSLHKWLSNSNNYILRELFKQIHDFAFDKKKVAEIKAIFGYEYDPKYQGLPLGEDDFYLSYDNEKRLKQNKDYAVKSRELIEGLDTHFAKDGKTYHDYAIESLGKGRFKLVCTVDNTYIVMRQSDRYKAFNKVLEYAYNHGINYKDAHEQMLSEWSAFCVAKKEKEEKEKALSAACSKEIEDVIKQAILKSFPDTEKHISEGGALYESLKLLATTINSKIENQQYVLDDLFNPNHYRVEFLTIKQMFDKYAANFEENKDVNANSYIRQMQDNIRATTQREYSLYPFLGVAYNDLVGDFFNTEKLNLPVILFHYE